MDWLTFLKAGIGSIVGPAILQTYKEANTIINSNYLLILEARGVILIDKITFDVAITRQGGGEIFYRTDD